MFPFRYLISYLSAFFRLRPGDVIAGHFDFDNVAVLQILRWIKACAGAVRRAGDLIGLFSTSRRNSLTVATALVIIFDLAPRQDTSRDEYGSAN